MATELKYQAKLIKLIKDECGKAWKVASGFTVGLPDILAAHPAFGSALIEMKVERDVPVEYKGFKIHTTELQKKTLREWREAGGKSFLIQVIEWRGINTTTISSIPINLERYIPDDAHRELVWTNKLTVRDIFAPNVRNLINKG